MSEHRIRLARAWNLRGAHFLPRRVDLPIAWDLPYIQDPFELVRQFHWPRIDPTTQVVDLELIDVPGLITVQMDGTALLLSPGGEDGSIRIALAGEDPGRRELTLLVNLAEVTLVRPWGSIVLVIRDRA